MLGRFAFWLSATSIFGVSAHAEEYFVRDQGEYLAISGQVEAGDVITLASGEWRDFEMVITGEGRADAPITVTAEAPGSVILTGQSNLRIGGDHVTVSGLVFRDGYSPTGEVIAFRRDSDDLARNARVTQTVIDSFSKPDRNESDYWVAIYGQNNRFDHNHLVGKTNRGVTLAVRLNTEDSRDNGHRIDHNYFGPRPVLGSNGGETLRIGTSHYSMFDSGTMVENNVFDRCDGEVEIISIKSGGNTVRGNLFLRSAGALTLRHGDGNLIERNVFLGDGKDHTGGIRVINRNQTVRGNYMEGLRGDGFASALTVMNGVPNSPVNRYVQVQNALIERNSVLDSSRITLGAGADEERSAAPVDSYMYANLFSGDGSQPFIDIDADISGITTASNVLLEGVVEGGGLDLPRREARLERGANGLLYPVDAGLAEIGAPRDLAVISLEEAGVDWYDKPSRADRFSGGSQIDVPANADALRAALAAAGNGDTLNLAAGHYFLERTLRVGKAVTITGPEGESADKAIISFTRPSLFELSEGGALRLQNLEIDGSAAPDSTGNAVIRTDSSPIRGNLRIELDGVHVHDLTVNRNFDVINSGPATLADQVRITRSVFENVSGNVVSATAESDDQGRYNVDYLDIEESAFRDITGAIADVYRGGRDESTFGPHVTVTNSVLENVGEGAATSLRLHGVQVTRVSDNIFTESAPIRITHTVGVPSTQISNNVFAGTPEPVATELVFPGEARVAMEGNTSTSQVGQ